MQLDCRSFCRYLLGSVAVMLAAFAAQSAASLVAAEPYRYDGRYCAGEGDTDFLRLIDESFAFLRPNPLVPNVAMLYRPDWDTFEEGANWGAWWIQNSYGFSYAATPFLQEPWFSTGRDGPRSVVGPGRTAVVAMSQAINGSPNHTV